MTRGVILQVNVRFRRAWFISYKLLANKRNKDWDVLAGKTFSYEFCQAGHYATLFPPTPRRIWSGASHAYAFPYAPTEFWKRGATCIYFLLRPIKSGNGALPANIFPYAPVEAWEARRYMQISSPTPRLDLGRGTTCKIYQLRPDAVWKQRIPYKFVAAPVVFWIRINLLWCFKDFLIYISR